MKGIILSGGKGTRLYPSTKVLSKQLLSVYDKPMIYYPLSTLMLGGIKEIALISTPSDLPQYEKLLGDGSSFGISIEYFEQSSPKGLAEAFIICKDFIGEDDVCLILGDNIFYGNLRIEEHVNNFKSGAFVFAYSVQDPERYGVLKLNNVGVATDIIEKPKTYVSNLAIPGFYMYDNSVVSKSLKLEPSDRGELEITDINRIFLANSEFKFEILGRGIAWFDVGTSESLQNASEFVNQIEKLQSHKIACLEEISLRKGFISLDYFNSIINKIPDSTYKDYLDKIRLEIEKWGTDSDSKLKEYQP